MVEALIRTLVVLLGIKSVQGQISWAKPAEGSTKTVSDPQTGCAGTLLSYEAFPTTGTVTYTLATVNPGSIAAPFSLDTTTASGQALLTCTESQVQENSYSVSVRADAGSDTSTRSVTIVFTNIGPSVTITAVSILTVVQNVFERNAALGGDITDDISYTFSVSDTAATVTIEAVAPDTACPFTAVSAGSGQYKLGLSGSLLSKPTTYPFKIVATPATGSPASVTVTATLSASTPIDGNWGAWGQWSECTSNCGESNQTRTRDCDSPAAAFGGQVCPGNDTELRAYPVFTAPYNTGSYTTNINEDVGSSANILTLSASDADGDSITFAFVGTVPASNSPLFMVVGADLQTIANIGTALDVDPANAERSYTLEVTASDGTLTATTTIVVNVDDVNDLDPVFTAGQNLDEAIPETTQAGQEVLKVTATDGDFSTPNNEITYSLGGTDNTHFTIDDTGSMKVASPSQLDYTTRSQYILDIIATDKATSNTRSATATATITLESAPTFTTPSDGNTVVQKGEDIGPGTVLFSCVVADEDTSNVGTLTLTVPAVDPASGATYFTMEGVTLKTSTSVTSTTFDLEAANAVSSYLITIRVSDGKYSADVNVRLNITDINDNNPAFSGALTQTINDNLGIGQDVTTVAAIDADVSTQFNTVTYSIQSSNGDDTYFTINENTGLVKLAKEPLKSTYLLTAKATDADNKEGIATLTITVTDTVDECSSTPCQNAGTCYNNINYYFCDCVNGWTGRICETNINDCDPNPCENNGDCTDGVASFTCNCSAGWTGNTCTQACVNNKYGRNCAMACQCNDTRLASGVVNQKCNITSGDCFCNDMWTGSGCQTDVDECAVNTSICSGAPNKACENSEGSYECVCAQGYTLNSTNACVATPENTTVTVNAGELLVKCTVTQDGLPCPDLAVPSVYSTTKTNIETSEKQQRFTDSSPQNLTANNISCGSLIYDLYIVINDTTSAKTTLARDLNNISNGLPLVLDNVTTVTSALTVAGKQVTINSTEDPTVQICNVYTAYSPCGADYECKISNGTPFCREKEKDRLGLILGLALGIPLGILGIVAVVVVLCYFRQKRFTEDDTVSLNDKRAHDSRRLQSSRRRGDESKSRLKSNHADYYPKTSDLPYTPSIEYDNYAVDPAWSRQNLSTSQKDWMFYKPAPRNSGNNYRQTKRY